MLSRKALPLGPRLIAPPEFTASTARCSYSEPMRTSSDERLLRRPQTKDSLRRRRRDVQSPSARTFSVSLSSVKRYANKASRGESLAPKKSPGSAPKLDERARKLLKDDLRERPFAPLQDRCDCIETLTGLSVSRSTMCRAIALIGPTRKKGDESPPSATSSRGRLGGWWWPRRWSRRGSS
jgi:transposase